MRQWAGTRPKPSKQDSASAPEDQGPMTKDQGPRTNTRTWLLIGLGFSVFWVLYLALLGPRRPALLENSGMSRPAEYAWSLLDLDDQPVRFSRFRGKPVFLNI